MKALKILRPYPVIVFTALLLFPLGAWAQPQQQPSERRGLKLEANGIKHTINLDVPAGWSVAPQYFKNSRGLIDVGPGESKRSSVRVEIYVEPRLSTRNRVNPRRARRLVRRWSSWLKMLYR